MSKGPDYTWLDRVPEAVATRFGPVTRRFLAAFKWVREKEGGPG